MWLVEATIEEADRRALAVKGDCGHDAVEREDEFPAA